MKAIFLDIDGVLNDSNPANFVSSACRLHLPDELYNLEDIFPIYINRLNNIIEATQAKIIISSSWRDTHPIAIIEKMFVMKGFKYPGSVIDKTNKLKPINIGVNHEYPDRGDEIADWIKWNSPIESFTILDDWKFEHFNMFPERFVHIQDGLEDKHVEKAIKILNLRT